MYIDNTEGEYFERRLEGELDMAGSAACDCARLAHEAMVAGYRDKLAGLLRSAAIQPRSILTLVQPAPKSTVRLAVDEEIAICLSNSAQPR